MVFFVLPAIAPATVIATTLLALIMANRQLEKKKELEQELEQAKIKEDLKYYKEQTLKNVFLNYENSRQLQIQNQNITEINGIIEQESYKLDNWIQYNNQINLDNINKFKQQEIKMFDLTQDIYEQDQRLNFLEWQVNNFDPDSLNQNLENLTKQDSLIIKEVEHLSEINNKQSLKINDLIYSLNALNEKEQFDTNYLITSFTNYQHQSNQRLNNLESNPIIQNPILLNTFDTRIKTLEDNDMNETKLRSVLTEVQSPILFDTNILKTQLQLQVENQQKQFLDQVVSQQLILQNQASSDNLLNQVNDQQKQFLEQIYDLKTTVEQTPTTTKETLYPYFQRINTDIESGNTNLIEFKTNINEQIKTGTEQLLNNNNDTKKIATNLGLQLGTMAIVTNSIATQTSPDALRSAAATGACQALNGGCQTTPSGGSVNNALNLLNAGLNSADLATTVTKLNKLQQTFDTFKSKFDKLYENLGVDRALRALDTALLLHNAMMLSNNLLHTLGDTIDVSLQLLKIPFLDDKGNEIGFTQSVTDNIKYIIISIIGNENYLNTVKSWNSLNRIYQSGANLLYSVRSLFDESLDYSEMIGEMLGKFMNTAKKDGLVSENSYPIQTEKLPPKSKFRKNFDAYSENLEEAEEALDSIAMIASSTLGIISEMNELSENSVEFAKVLNDEEKALDDIYNKDKTDSILPDTNVIRDDYKPI